MSGAHSLLVVVVAGRTLTPGSAKTRHFGQEILSTLLQEPVSSPVVETLYLKMYQDFVEAFDGIDNGVAQYVSSEPPRYRSRTDISSRVGALNPRWNEPSNDEVLLERFEKASELAGNEFKERLDYLAKAWLPARDIVKRAVEKRKDVHPSGKVLIFDEFAPWKVRPPFCPPETLPTLSRTGHGTDALESQDGTDAILRNRRAGAPPHPRAGPVDPGKRAPAVRPVPGIREARLEVARSGCCRLARIVREPQGSPRSVSRSFVRRAERPGTRVQLSL